jgi:hypothetical protein
MVETQSILFIGTTKSRRRCLKPPSSGGFVAVKEGRLEKVCINTLASAWHLTGPIASRDFEWNLIVGAE